MINVGQLIVLAYLIDSNLCFNNNDRFPKILFATSFIDVNGLIKINPLGFLLAATCIATPVPIDRPINNISSSCKLK